MAIENQQLLERMVTRFASLLRNRENEFKLGGVASGRFKGKGPAFGKVRFSVIIRPTKNGLHA